MSTTPTSRTRRLGRRIPVELTRDATCLRSARTCHPDHAGCQRNQVLICPNEVEEAEDPGYEVLGESMSAPDATPRGMAVLETLPAKDREGYELDTPAHAVVVQCVCVRAKGVDERHLRRPAGKRAEDQGVDHFPVIQFDYANVSSGDGRGQQVKMRTILDTSTGYGTVCVCDRREGCRGQVRDFFGGVVLERTRVARDFDAGRIPSQRSRHTWMRSSSVWQMIAHSSKFCQRRLFPRVTRVWVPWRAGRVFCRDRSEPYGSTLRRDLGSGCRCYSSVRAVACETRHLAAEQIPAKAEWCDPVVESEAG